MRKGLSYAECGRIGGEKSKIRSTELKKDRIDAYNQSPKLCRFCDSQISYEKRRNDYCSQSCSASFNNKGKNRYKKRFEIEPNIRQKYSKLRNVEERICSWCSKIFVTNTNKKFCSYSCCAKPQGVYRRNKNNARVIAGELVTSKACKIYLIDTLGECCQKCKWNERHPITGKVPIELEHIDGNFENNSLNNLTLLCPNCHSLTSTYKALNRGNGRFKRMQRYSSGKSF